MPRSRPHPSAFELHAAEQQVDRWVKQNTGSDREFLDKCRHCMCGKPTAVWLGDWYSPCDAAETAASVANDAKNANGLFQLVLYNIPNRDLGGYSAGGCEAEKYLDWVRRICEALRKVSARGIIVVEPDALPHSISLHSSSERDQRFALIREACLLLRHNCPDCYIYVDIGHPMWLQPERAAELLTRANVAGTIDGFSLNVSNSCRTLDCYAYGMEILKLMNFHGGFVIDTSRNGAGPPTAEGEHQWANVRSLRLGPTGSTRWARENGYSSKLHAVLWIKPPGESDGATEGAPSAGEFWPDSAWSLMLSL